MSGFSSLKDILIIKYDLMRHLHLQPSEIMALPLVERNRYHRWVVEEVEKHNRDVEQYNAKVKEMETRTPGQR